MARCGGGRFAALGVLSSNSSASLCSRYWYGHLDALLLTSKYMVTGSGANMLRS